MIALRQAAEMALEAWSDPQGMPKLCKAFDALREALAQPEQEPVAWICKKNGKRWLAWNSTEHIPSFSTMEPLYLHPAPKPEEWDSRELGADEAYVSISETTDEEINAALARPEQEPYAYTAEGECWWNRFTNYALAQAHLDSLRIPEERRLYLYLHPAPIPEGWQLVNHNMTPEQRQLMLRAEEFTVDEMWIMLLAAAPKPE